MCPSKQNWQMLISLTKMFNIFPSSIQVSSISKILTANCKIYTFEYIPTRELWLNRLYFETSNSNKKICLTIDCRNCNVLGPSKFELMPKVELNRFAVIIEIEKISHLIVF